MIPETTSDLFEWKDGLRLFRGLAVEEHVIPIAGRDFRVASMRDAAGLLDDPEYGKRFVELDVAPYGLELWPAAGMLTEFILKSEPGQGRRVLDLGCGLALVSMAAKLAGWHVSAADNDETALRFAKYNCDLNGISPDEFTVLDWHNPPDEIRYERIFGADILYQRVDHQPILTCVGKLLAVGGIALLADPCRSVAERVPELARASGFCVETIGCTGFSCTGQAIKGRIFKLTRVTEA
ncbi:MAG: 50S ribosomal protein L11 methyltransferase [Planctomycetes bacterium]|nr:50S ribosomal protein L11 methyltransferase [Planctomycetota bacterium]MBI3834590.1 50S ribosomal protein L11 methyltransferase [Planctomycetota bacterium]